MKHTRTVVGLLALIMLASLLVGCGLSSIEVGMVEMDLSGRWEASCILFTGARVDTVQAGAKDALVLEYKAEVKRGDLRLEVRGQGGGILWDASLREDGGDTVRLVLDHAGAYTVVIQGDGAAGTFDVSWEVQPKGQLAQGLHRSRQAIGLANDLYVVEM